jgi:hypothetical protein
MSGNMDAFSVPVWAKAVDSQVFCQPTFAVSQLYGSALTRGVAVTVTRIECELSAIRGMLRLQLRRKDPDSD